MLKTTCNAILDFNLMSARHSYSYIDMNLSKNKHFPVWLRNRFISAVLQPVLRHTENHV